MRLIVLAVVIVATLLLAFGVADAVELPLRDRLLRFLPEKAAKATVVIAIDERSLREVGPWPWSRETLATLVDRAVEAKARAVMFDILLTDPRPGDDVLARSLKRLPTAAVSVLVDDDEWLDRKSVV